MLSTHDFTELVIDYYKSQSKFKKAQGRFGEIKATFYNRAEAFFQDNSIDKAITIDCGFVDGLMTVTRVQSSKVIFDPNKLEKKLGKDVSEKIIEKRYEVVDMAGLIAYLKECGVDPKIFKSFISVTKSVDVKELDRLEELGKITTDQIRGCYTIKSQDPYFTIKLEKDRSDE